MGACKLESPTEEEDPASWVTPVLPFASCPGTVSSAHLRDRSPLPGHSCFTEVKFVWAFYLGCGTFTFCLRWGPGPDAAVRGGPESPALTSLTPNSRSLTTETQILLMKRTRLKALLKTALSVNSCVR